MKLLYGIIAGRYQLVSRLDLLSGDVVALVAAGGLVVASPAQLALPKLALATLHI